MSTRMSGCIVAVLMLAGTVLGEVKVVVELVPSIPGPYVGGEQITVDVWLHSQVPEDWSLWVIQFDFRDTDPQLTLDPTFTFDFSTLQVQPNDYLDGFYPELPVPWTQNITMCSCPERFLHLSGNASFHIGTIGVQLPTEAGTYQLDLTNADEEPVEVGGIGALLWVIDRSDIIGGILSEQWRAYSGELVGGSIDLVVPPPIPAVSQIGMVLLAGLFLTIGGWMIARNTRRNAANLLAVLVLSCCGVLPFLCSVGVAAPADLPAEIVVVDIDSGTVEATGGGMEPVLIWSNTIEEPGSLWMRLHFDSWQLSSGPGGSDASYLRISSTADGTFQIMDAAALGQWADSSAFFNGDEVVIELWAYPGTGDNQVGIDHVAIGPDAPEAPQGVPGICDKDTRVRSADPRVAKITYLKGPNCTIGICTGFLFDNRPGAILTAGHCCEKMNFDCSYAPVVSFYSSTPEASAFPDSADQYTLYSDNVNHFSMRYEYAGWGSDWCYFRVHDNNTHPVQPAVPYAPLERQGASFTLFRGALPQPTGELLRVTGYGYDNDTPLWTLLQQSTIGSFESLNSNTIRFLVDTQQGNSGSPLFRQCGPVYGIVTAAGCPIQANGGPTVSNTNLQAAIAHLPLPIDPDCNANGIDDECDVDCGNPGGACDVTGCGQSSSCDGDDIPDECEPDCNGNGVPDECDITAQTSDDCNGNLMPDECEPDRDCNSNGRPDICDIGCGEGSTCDGVAGSADCDGNFVPDECEGDCNGNGEHDICDVDPSDPDGNGVVSNDCNVNFIPDECEPDEDCNSNARTDICDIGCGEGNTCDGIDGSSDCNCNNVPDECDLSSGTSLDCNVNGVPDDCDVFLGDCNSNGLVDECEIEDQTEQDCNGNDVPDACEIRDGQLGDCNGNGIPDVCDIYYGSSGDCNGNNVPDECDIYYLASEDCNDNGVPDECEPDCNWNGDVDECDITGGTSEDCNGNNVPDECETISAACCLVSRFGVGSCITTTESDCQQQGGNFSCALTCAQVYCAGWNGPSQWP